MTRYYEMCRETKDISNFKKYSNVCKECKEKKLTRLTSEKQSFIATGNNVCVGAMFLLAIQWKIRANAVPPQKFLNIRSQRRRTCNSIFRNWTKQKSKWLWCYLFTKKITQTYAKLHEKYDKWFRSMPI